MNKTAQNKIKGMKWIMYTMDTTPKFYKTIRGAKANSTCCPTYCKKIVGGYEQGSENGQTFWFERIASFKDSHIEEMVKKSIQGEINETMWNIEHMMDKDQIVMVEI